MCAHVCQAAIAGRELLYKFSFLLVILLGGVACKLTVSCGKMLINYPCEYIAWNPIRYYEPHAFSTSLTAHVVSPQSGRPILCGGYSNIPCVITHPCGGYYTTKKTGTQRTIACQTKSYTPHNLDISYYRTTIVPAILHDHEDKNTEYNSPHKQRTAHHTILN